MILSVRAGQRPSQSDSAAIDSVTDYLCGQSKMRGKDEGLPRVEGGSCGCGAGAPATKSWNGRSS